MKMLERNQVLRLVLLGLAVILEALALGSVILRDALIPGTAYPYIISVALFLLPSVIGLLSRRLEVAVVLAVLPFWTLAVVYLATRAPLWYVDLFENGVLAGRVAGVSIVLGFLGLFGWLIRRILLNRSVAKETP